MGATITVRKCRFNSSGAITRQGRVFWISLPKTGSSRTRCTSPRLTCACATASAIPFRQTGWTLLHRALDRRRERASPSPHPPIPPLAVWPHEQSACHFQPAVRLRPAIGHVRVILWERGCPSSFRFEQFWPWRSCDYIVITSHSLRISPPHLIRLARLKWIFAEILFPQHRMLQ